MPSQTFGATSAPFIDRRVNPSNRESSQERRQFANSHAGLSPQARELAEAIDHYKVQYRRRYITFEEMLNVIHELGYRKTEKPVDGGASPAMSGTTVESAMG